jgi:hypothetical protein
VTQQNQPPEHPDHEQVQQTDRHEPHYCIGSNLGKATLRSILRELLTRLPDIEAGEPRYIASCIATPSRKTPGGQCVTVAMLSPAEDLRRTMPAVHVFAGPVRSQRRC